MIQIETIFTKTFILKTLLMDNLIRWEAPNVHKNTIFIISKKVLIWGDS